MNRNTFIPHSMYRSFQEILVGCRDNWTGCLAIYQLSAPRLLERFKSCSRYPSHGHYHAYQNLHPWWVCCVSFDQVVGMYMFMRTNAGILDSSVMIYNFWHFLSSYRQSPFWCRPTNHNPMKTPNPPKVPSWITISHHHHHPRSPYLQTLYLPNPNTRTRICVPILTPLLKLPPTIPFGPLKNQIPPETVPHPSPAQQAPSNPSFPSS